MNENEEKIVKYGDADVFKTVMVCDGNFRSNYYDEPEDYFNELFDNGKIDWFSKPKIMYGADGYTPNVDAVRIAEAIERRFYEFGEVEKDFKFTRDLKPLQDAFDQMCDEIPWRYKVDMNYKIDVSEEFDEWKKKKTEERKMINEDNYTSEMIKRYGDKQLLKASEELSELNVEIMKKLNGEYNEENMISELADVYIMLDSIIKMCNINPDEFWKMIDFKINRQIARENEKEDKGGKWENQNTK